MSKLIDLTGQQIGQWRVLKRAGTYSYVSRNGSTKTVPTYLCKCKCGTVARVRTDNLRNGGSKSCGCLRAERNSQRLKEIYRRAAMAEEKS